MSNFSISLIIGASVGGAVAGIKQVISGFDTLRDRSLSTNDKMKALGKTSLASFGAAISTATGVGTAVMGLVAPAIEFEGAMSGVAKQLDGARDSTGKLTEEFYKTRAEIMQLGRVAPASLGEIAGIYEQGLKTGVAKENLQAFATMAIAAGEAFGTSASELSETMGRVGKLYGRDMAGMKDLMDRINYLDDNAESSGADIIRFMQKVGGTATMVKMSDTQIAAYGSTLLTLGEQADTAATAMNAVFSKLGAANTQAKPFKDMLESIGFTPEEIANGMQTDANATIQMLNNRIKSLPTLSDGKNPTQIDAVSTLFGGEYWDTYSKFLGGNELDRQLKLADSDNAKGSMDREYEARKQTTAAQMQMFKSRVSEVAITLGDALLPVINQLMTSVQPMVVAFGEWVKTHPTLINGMIKLGAMLTAGTVGFGLISGVVTGAMGLFVGFGGAVMSGVRVAGIAFKMLSGQYGLVSGLMRLGLPVRGFFKSINAIKTAFLSVMPVIGNIISFAKLIGTSLVSAGLKIGQTFMMIGRVIAIAGRAMLTNPIILIGVAIAGVAYLIYKNWDTIKPMLMNFWQSISQYASNAWQWIVGIWNGFSAWFGGLWDGVTTWASNTWTAISTGASAAWGWLVGIWGIATSWFSGLWQSVKAVAVGVWTGITGFIGSVWASIKGLVSAGVQGLLSIIRGFSPVSAFTTAFGAVWGFLGGLASRFFSFGQNIIQGLLNGIRSMAGTVVSAISGVVGNVTGTAKRMLGINSPSRVFRQFGGWVSEGLSIGIDNGGNRPINAIGNLAKGVTANFGAKMGNLSADVSASVSAHNARMTNGGAGVGANGNITIHYNPTINANGGEMGKIETALQLSQREFEKMFARMQADRLRRAY